MENNNIKVILSFNDTNISITLFNSVQNEQFILFYKESPLKQGWIKNGFIVNSQDVLKVCQHLIYDACLFTEFKISNVYVSIDCSEITIKPLELEEKTLDDGIFDKILWDKLRKSVTINQISDKYIYDLEFNTWIIDGKEYTSIDNQIAGNKLVIRATAYQINKVLYKQYINLLEKLNIKWISLKPLLNDLASITDSIKNNHHELFAYVNNHTLTIVQTSGRRLVRCVQNSELGLNKLYEVIANTNNLTPEYVEKIMTTTITHGSNINQIEIINGYSSTNGSLEKINGSSINNLMGQYAKCLVECVECNANFLLEKKNIKVSKITYVPINQISNKLINLTQMCTSTNSCIYANEFTKEYGDKFTQTKLLMTSIVNNIKNEDESCVQPLTNKEIKNLKGMLKQ